MPYCPRCGVETDPSVRRCPLCSTPIPTFEDLGPGEPAWPSTETSGDLSKTYPSSTQVRARAFAAGASVLGVGALAVILVNLLVDGSLTWCRYPLAALATVFGGTAAVFAWYRNPGRWGLAWALLSAAFLAAVDGAAEGKLGWFWSLGLPIDAVSWGLIFLGTTLVRRSRHRGYDIFAWMTALVALELVAIDFLVTYWTVGHPGLGWSLVTTLALGPLALLLTLFHFTLRNPPDLGRTFHF